MIREEELKKLINRYENEKREIEIKIRKAKIERRQIKAKRFLKNAVYKRKPHNRRKEKH